MSAAETDPAPGVGPREERYRIAAIAAGAPLVLLTAPLLLPLHGSRSPLVEASQEPVAFLIVVGLVTWSILTGCLSLTYGLRRRVPGIAAFAMPAAVFALESGGTALLALYVLAKAHGQREQPLLAATAFACSLAVYLLLRGFRRAGWERWAQLVGGMWVGHGTISLLAVFADDSPFAALSAGPWLLLFALGALAPIVGWMLWPRKGEAPLLRSRG